MANLLTKMLEAKFRDSRDELLAEVLKPITLLRAELDKQAERLVTESLDNKRNDIESAIEKMEHCSKE